MNITKSLAGIFSLSLFLTSSLASTAATKSHAIKLSYAGGRQVKSGIVKGATMRLAGRHTFTVKPNRKAVTWTLDREEASEDGGAPVLFKNVATASGATATFDLTKIPDKETVYHVRARGPGLDDVLRMQVFPPDKRSSFTYRSAGNPDVRTYVVVPATLSPKTRIVMVMHGRSRNADSYIDTWVDWAARQDYIALAPRFDDKHWEGDDYNLGNIFTGKNGKGVKNPESQWSFTVVEGIHEQVRAEFRLDDPLFDIWGHSAGGQFVHRLMLFKPNAKIRYAMPANSGWYTTPDLSHAFPHGIKHPLLSLEKRDLVRWTTKPVVIFRGTADTLRTENLSMTPESDAQGQNRYERAAFMYRKVKAFDPQTNWRMIDVPDAGHDQQKMAPAAQDFLRTHTTPTRNKMSGAK